MDYKKIKEDAKNEILVERAEEAKEVLKDKYRELADVKLVVTNIEREIEDVLDQIGQGKIPETE